MLSNTVEQLLDEIREGEEYSCGAALFEEDDHQRHSVVVRRQVNCQSLIETTYYAARIELPSICIHCGSTSGAPLKEDETIAELKRQHTIVR